MLGVVKETTVTVDYTKLVWFELGGYVMRSSWGKVTSPDFFEELRLPTHFGMGGRQRHHY